MKPLPLNIQTLFGDLQQKMTFAEHVPAHILRRTLKGNDWVYAQEKHGSVKKQRLLGRAGDPAVEAEAEALKSEAANAKLRRQIVGAKSADLPKRFRADNGLEVELVTPVRNRADEAAGVVPIPAIGAGAMPLPFLDFLLSDAVTTTAL